MRRSAKSNPSISSWVRKASTRLSVSMEKKARAELRPQHARNVAGSGAVSTFRSAEVRHHPPVAPARCAVREEAIAAFGAAPWRDRDVLDTQLARLPRQHGPQIDPHRPGVRRHVEPRRDFRTYFIAFTANAYTTMHYNIARFRKPAPLQELHGAREHARGGASPAGVHQRDGALVRYGQIDGDAVGDGDREQHPALPGRVAVEPVEDQPSLGQGFVPAHGAAVHLMAQDDRRKPRRERGAKRPPTTHDLAHLLVTPQAKAQGAERDAGDEPVALGPLGKLEPRYGRVAGGGFAEHLIAGRRDAQFGPPGPAAARRCARNPARSARCSG